MSLLLLLRSHDVGPALPPPLIGIKVAGTYQRIKAHTLRISKTVNGQGRVNFTVDSPTTSYRPALEEEVILNDQGFTAFGGYVNAPTERGLGSAVGKHSTDVSALDYNSIATRRYVSATIPAGTMKAALEYILPLLSNVTLDPAQADGPALPELVYPLIRVDKFLDELSVLTNGWMWKISATKVLLMYEPGSLTAPWDLTAGDGHAIGDVIVEELRSSEYANTVFLHGGGVTSYAMDVPEQVAHGIWELPVVVSEPVTQEVGDALTASFLGRSLVTPKKVIYQTHTPGLDVGMTQFIDLPDRDVYNTYLITQLEGYQGRAVVSGSPIDIIEWQVTALEGIVYKTGWREYYKPGSVPFGVPALGGGGGGTSFVRSIVPFGGTKLESYRNSDGTSWIFVGNKVQVDTVPRGTNSLGMNLELSVRTSGVGVKARLYDLTDSVACAGESSTVTSTTPQFVSFTATLTSGSHIYRPQIRVDTPEEDATPIGIYGL